MNFTGAVKAMKQGKAVKRPHWETPVKIGEDGVMRFHLRGDAADSFANDSLFEPMRIEKDATDWEVVDGAD